MAEIQVATFSLQALLVMSSIIDFDTSFQPYV